MSIAIAVCGSVTALYAGAGLRADGNGSGGLADPHAAELHTVLLAVVLLLSIMAAVNIAFVTRASVTDARRMLAVARTLGATPRAAAIALGVAQILPTLVGLGLGMASGSLLFHAIAHDVTSAPTVVQLAGLSALTLAVVVTLTALPARIEARQPIATAFSRS